MVLTVNYQHLPFYKAKSSDVPWKKSLLLTDEIED